MITQRTLESEFTHLARFWIWSSRHVTAVETKKNIFKDRSMKWVCGEYTEDGITIVGFTDGKEQ